MTKLKRADGVAAYRYTFYKPGSMEDVAATIEVDEPLPHVEVGNSVGLLKTDTGFHWRIVHIELDLQPAELGSERPIGIHVYSQDRNRAEIIQILAAVRPRP
jgi:hypothetical protein